MTDNYRHFKVTMNDNGVLFVNVVKMMVLSTQDISNQPFQSSSFMSFSMLGMSMENLLIRLKAWIGFPTSLLA